MGLGAAILKISAVRSKEIRHDSRNQTELEPAVGDVIQHGRILDNSQRVVERRDIAHGADTQLPCARRSRRTVDRRRRHPAFVGVEVVLDAKPKVEAALIGKSDLAPELVVALGGVHARLIPNMREVSEFHRNISRKDAKSQSYKRRPKVASWGRYSRTSKIIFVFFASSATEETLFFAYDSNAAAQ